MLRFQSNPVERVCPQCGRIFRVQANPRGMKQGCLFCGVPLVDKKEYGK